MPTSYVLLLAFGIGIIAGLRSLTAPAVVAWLRSGWLNLHGTSLAFMDRRRQWQSSLFLPSLSWWPINCRPRRRARSRQA